MLCATPSRSGARDVMLSILIANTKGGSGKTTIATGLAAGCAAAGLRTALADADRQRSSLAWLRARPGASAPIAPLDWSKSEMSVPEGLHRLIIDSAAASKTSRIEELVRLADVVIVPVQPSPFDETATARFLRRLDEIKPVRKGRKAVAVVGNRMRPRTRAAARLDSFLADCGHVCVARMRDRAIYCEAAASGLSAFDLGTRQASSAREDWIPLVRFIEAHAR
jgi:chromosome partitioning protein